MNSVGLRSVSELETTGRKHRKTIAERIWSKVERRAPDECWPWTGRYEKNGYGVLGFRIGPRWANKQVRRSVHRLIYELTYGPVPDGLVVRHLCNNTKCCNPAHLASGTHQDNMDDMVRAGRSTAGERNPRARLTADDVERIRYLRAAGWTYKRIGNEYGVHLATIHAICSGKTWTSAEHAIGMGLQPEELAVLEDESRPAPLAVLEEGET